MYPSVPDVVEYQLPESIRNSENSQFIALLKHYYNWLVEKGQPTEFIHNIMSYRDIDLTDAGFRQHLTTSLLDAIPSYSKADRKLLTKHIADFLRSKGTYESFQFLMTAIYGEEMEMVWNSNNILRPSANEYSRRATLAIESTLDWKLVEGSEIVQTSPKPARAIIESCTSTTHNGKQIQWLELNDKSVVGKFVPGSKVKVLKNNVNRSWYYEEGYYQPKTFANGSLTFYAVTEKARPYENLIVKQIGSTFRCVVDKFVSRYKESGRTRVTLTVKDVTGTFVPGNEIYIFAPTVENTLYTYESFETGVVSNAIVNVNTINGGSLYSVGDRIQFLNGSGINVDGYIADVSAGGIDSVNIIKKGYGYSVGDVLQTIDENTGGSGAIVEVSNIDGIDGQIDLVSELNTIQIVHGGSGYVVNDELEIPGGSGFPPARVKVATVDATWSFIGVKVTASGSRYPRYTKIALINHATNTLISGFAATPVFNTVGGITAVTVTSVPTISVDTLSIIANGYGAVASAVLVSGAVDSITLNNGGVNYVDPIVEVQGDGTGAVYTVEHSNGVITGFTKVRGGSGYTFANIVIKERYGTGFTAVPLIRNQAGSSGSITSVTILERGEYTAVPPCFNVQPDTVTGSGEGAVFNMDFRLKSATLANNGQFYHAIQTEVSGNGEGAVLVPIIRDGVVSSLRKNSGGSGYTYAYVFIEGGTGFVGRANIVSGAVDSITIINGGFGYNTGSVVTIMGDGVGASYDLLGVGNIKQGVLQTVYVKDGGKNYYYGTTITCPASEPGSISATLTPIIENGVIKSVLSNGGEGYVESDLSNLVISRGTEPIVTAVISGFGGVIGSTALDQGSGYWSQSEVTPLSLTASIGTGAKFLPTLSDKGEFVKVDVLDGGSGYTLSSTITVSGGAGTGAVLKPVVFGGRITDVVIENSGSGYKYGTYAVIVGDGIDAVLTPIVETGITSVEVVNGGQLYSSSATIIVTDTDRVGTGNIDAVIKPVIKNGVITDLKIIKKGTGYVKPVLTVGKPGPGYGAELIAVAKRNIKQLNINNKGSGYTYADVIIVGDGESANFSLKFDKLGSIDTVTLTNPGTGIVATPKAIITDPSNYGAVSKVKIKAPGGGYRNTPILVLPNKYDMYGNIIATGAKFTCFGSRIGSVRSVMFDNHGAGYDDAPTPIFPIVAQLVENAAFKVGETVTIKSGLYKDVDSTNYTLLENGGRVLLENGDLLTLDKDESYFDKGVTAKVIDFDYDRNIIKLLSGSDIFTLVSERNETIITQNHIKIVDEMSGSFDVGNVIVGSKSGAHATIKHLNRANGTAVKGGNGWTAFSYANDVGMLNNKLSVIADNQKFQDYAYVIRTGIAIKDYEKLVKETVHPAGFSMFGEVVTQTMTPMGILDEIGYNKLLTIVYILSISADYQSGPEWSETSELFGDYTKFNYKFLPISHVKDMKIHQTSDIIFKNYEDYVGSPIVSTLLEKWTASTGARLLRDVGLAPDGSMTLHRLSDNNTGAAANYSSSVVSNIGDKYSFKIFVKKQTNPQSYPAFEILNDTANRTRMSLNTETGEVFSILGSANSKTIILDMGDYWHVEVQHVATSTSTKFFIYPALGFTTSLSVVDNMALGYVEVSKPIVKKITGLTPYATRIRAVNSQYVPQKWYIASQETEINISNI